MTGACTNPIYYQGLDISKKLHDMRFNQDRAFSHECNATAATTRERDQEHHQLAQSHDVLAAQLVEIRAAMDALRALS
jgi:hypothetical protein